jgi:hypothetical protein
MLAKLDWLVVPRLDTVDNAFEATFASRLGFRPKAGLLKCTEHDNSFQVIRQILKHTTAKTLEYSLAHQSAANPEIRSIEANHSAVCEFHSAGSTQARNKSIAAHFANKFKVAMHSECVIGSFNQIVRNWRVVTGMFTVVPSPISKTTLICLS